MAAVKLASRAMGSWYLAPDDGAPVLDAVTGEEVARVSAAGLDVAGMRAHAVTVGGPALRALTFHQRALALKALAAELTAAKEEFYRLSARTGATRGDAWFDVDGGIAALASYASRGRRELPNDTVYVEGPVERLSRRGSFVGQHVCVPRRGVAVQINAFNFPVWGMLEKLAPAVLAGVPTIVKPASQTAYVTAAVVRRIVESGALPEGTVQCICGTPPDLLDHLGGQDSVHFTGSADTASRLRAHPAVLTRGLRFNAEADSLNCSILGPDAGPGTPEFDLYLAEVVREMTVKAGQKCTAIRRAIVPAAHRDAVVAALTAALELVRVGHPADPEVTMGALASLGQRQEVRRQVERLRAAARLVHGDPASPTVLGADPERGAFLGPLLLVADDPRAAPVHEVEAFGPVTTVLGYSGADDAVELAALGRGSLVGSVASADPGFVRDIVLGTAAHHGRLLVLDRDDARESTGHGSPLPTLVHGGPGRAGGGEELGGIRAVLHHLQRTAVQGSPAMVAAVTGRYVAGAPRRTGPEHPFRRSLAELRVGDSVTAGPRVVSQQDIEHFAEFTGDRFYAHLDEQAAAANPFFDGRVAHGYLVLAFAAGLFVDPAPGPVLANTGLAELRFAAPVYPGDAITATLTCQQKNPRETEPYGEVRWLVEVTNQRDELVASYTLLTMVAKAADRDAGPG